MNAATDKKQERKVTFQEYNKFVSQIDVSDIRLVSANVEVLDYSYYPTAAEVKWRMRASYEKGENEFSASHRYNVIISDKETNEKKARISVTFYVVYPSEIEITDDLWEIFKIRNLPLNTWPYFREFVHNITARLGWPTFIAPTYTP